MLLKIAYLGENFYGFSKQKNLRTVQGEIEKALKIFLKNFNVKVASRTDRGVSALGNIVYVNNSLENVCRKLSFNLKNIWVYEFSLDNCSFGKKHYKYFLAGEYDKKVVLKACKFFSGLHDFKNFCIPEGKNTVKKIEIVPEFYQNLVVLNFYGNFLWQMVRRIVTGIKIFGEVDDAEKLFTGDKKIKASPPDYLVLWDVECKAKFFRDEYVTNAMKNKFLDRFYHYLTHKKIFEEMIELL